jgi:hypothetical protein
LVEKFALTETRCFEASHSPQIFVALEGSGAAGLQGGAPVRFARGDAVVVPAAALQVGIRPEANLELLRATLPIGRVREPETMLET